MAIHDVLKMGDPRLLAPARPVEDFASPELAQLIVDMHVTMRSLDGAGLAAPQIGVGLQVVIFEINVNPLLPNPRYPNVEAVPFTVLINPLLTPLSDVMEDGWEGCLSVPGLRGLVPRHAELRYQGFDATGGPIDRSVSGFHARVVQHEVDHLNGVLYPMRIRNLRDFGYTETLFPGQHLQDD
ncbi:MAG: peptide deformylase [Sulfuriferula multivorans]|uniref:Peptide deformylase n=1 Tax=Sulfuriferula multivorans TaxID=1559896 RepID=A0A7C9NTS3_9PROT|nr:peptide deformylase [Sulfuriferula multivorans]